MPIALARKVDLGFAAALAVVAITGGLAYRSARQLVKTEQLVTESSLRAEALKDLFETVMEAETSRRGWTLTGDEAQRTACRSQLLNVERNMAAIGRMTAGDPVQAERARRLGSAVAAKTAHVAAALGAPRELAAQEAITRRGTELRERIRGVVLEMHAEESRRLASLLGEARRTGSATTLVVTATVLLALAAVAVALVRLHRDMDRRREAEEARKRSEEELRRLEAILEATPDVVGIARPDGAPVWLNRSGREAMGIGAAASRPGCSAFSFFPPWARERMRSEGIPAAIRDGFWIGETAFFDATGSEVACSQVILSHRDETGNVAFVSSILRDISERKDAERLRQELVATVSHELKTPLTALSLALHVVHDHYRQEGSPEAQKLLDVARRNSDRLDRLVRDIVEAERLESGGLSFDLRPTSLAPILSAAVDSIRPLAQARGVRLAVDTGAEDARALVDAERMAQVFTNLLSNAVKFSPENGVVEVVLERVGPALRVSVRDRGRGISESFRRRVFSRFAQAEASDRREKGGTGLGLAIAKAIVERHGGRIDFAAREGGGTTFFVELAERREAPAERGAGLSSVR